MGLFTVILAVTFFVVIPNSAGFGSCPPPSKVYSHKPVCRDNYDCKGGKVCCPNTSNTKSCTEPARGGNVPDDKGNQGGPGVYCGNTKCMPYEKCVKDPYTGRLVCRRS